MFNIKNLLLLVIIIFSISCGNSMVDPNDNNTNTNYTIKNTNNNTTEAEYPIYVYYGSKSSTVNSYEELESLWKGMVSGKTIYSELTYNTNWITGAFKEDANYYEKKYENSNKARTVFVRCTTKELEGKLYIAGVYYDNYNQYNMPNDWRLIVIDDYGTEHAWYGGGRDRNNIPDDNTQWVYYDFRFGYLKEY